MTYETVPVTRELCERVMCGALTRDDLGKILNTDPVTAGFSCSYAGYVGVHTPCETMCQPYLEEINAKAGSLGMQRLTCSIPKQPPVVELPSEVAVAPAINIVPTGPQLPANFVTPEMIQVPRLRCGAGCGISGWVDAHPLLAAGLVIAAFAVLKGGRN
jgi:hypothetical protein